jgi:uncharacterized integral membrane protein
MSDSAERKGMSNATRIKLIVAGVVAILATIVMFQNTDEVSTKILFWELNLPGALLLVVMLAAGFFLGLLAMTLRHRRQAREHG